MIKVLALYFLIYLIHFLNYPHIVEQEVLKENILAHLYLKELFTRQ